MVQRPSWWSDDPEHLYRRNPPDAPGHARYFQPYIIARERELLSGGMHPEDVIVALSGEFNGEKRPALGTVWGHLRQWQAAGVIDVDYWPIRTSPRGRFARRASGYPGASPSAPEPSVEPTEASRSNGAEAAEMEKAAEREARLDLMALSVEALVKTPRDAIDFVAILMSYTVALGVRAEMEATA